MARKVNFDSCMFCGDEPCDMHKPKKKPAPKPRKKAVATKATEPKCGWCTPEERAAGMPCACNVPPDPAPVSDDPPVTRVPRKAAAHAAMRARVKPSASPVTAPSAAADAVTDDAIRALAPILHPDEVRNRRDVLSRPRTVEVRAAAWREKRRGA